MNMSKATKKVSKTPTDLLTMALIQTFEPLVNALDFDMDNFGSLQKPNEDSDTGQQLKSQRDNGIRFLVSGICQAIWRQNHGVITDKNGNVYDNSRQRLLRSEKQKAELEKNFAQDVTTDDLAVLYWFKVNEERYHAQQNLLTAFTTLYRHITNEDWKPYGEKAADEKTTTKRTLSPEEIAKINEMFNISSKRYEAHQEASDVAAAPMPF
jgi:hypothetical protein